jgi:hypothetical protein
MSVWKAIGWFAGGILTGSAGFKALGSSDAKKVYTHATAAALRCKECTMESVTKIRENAEDILADAKMINEERADAQADEIIEDAAAEE